MTIIRPVRESDLPEVARIFRLAFGTFIGVPKPEELWLDRDYIFTRWRIDPEAALAAEVNGELVGSNFAVNWGSFGYFGPLTVRPDLWSQRVAQALLEPTMDLFAKWGVRESGLFTFAHSARHVGLYQKFGFWPRFLTALMSKPAAPATTSALNFSSLSAAHRDQAIAACRQLTDAIYEGLDVTPEIRSVSAQNLGETLLLWDGDSLDAFAICHCGEGTEAGKDTCYIKFAAVRPGTHAAKSFDRLLDACDSLAASRSLGSIKAGVNLARSHAYRQMLQRGFRSEVQGVAMHRPDSPGYNLPENLIIDDWR